MNNLYLTNSLTKQKEIFKPINSEKITLYACGPTVYDKPHDGNARALVIFDLIITIYIFIINNIAVRIIITFPCCCHYEQSRY